MASDKAQDLLESVKHAAGCNASVCIQGSNTKKFYGRGQTGDILEVGGHNGIVSYEPTELVITVRSGTLLSEVKSVLGNENQMLAFDPPGYGTTATIGGTIACGFSGPRRPYLGSARDFVLGVRMINGKGEDLRFGGQVMKNVAGYDVSRLMTGSLGTLGLILEVSLKVLPMPSVERTTVLEINRDAAAKLLADWARKPSPISATCHHENRLHVRFSGSEKGVSAALEVIGGEELPESDLFWGNIREHRHSFFLEDGPLWRVAVPPAAEQIPIDGDCLAEWSGALRWMQTDSPADRVRLAVEAHGGHAVCFRGGDRDEPFHPLSPSLRRLHEKIKQSFDPGGIFNPGRMYREI